MKKTIQLTLLLITLLSFSSNKALAYDIKVENKDGVTIYYNYSSDGKELSVTCLYANTDKNQNAYKGTVAIPDEVTYMSKTRKVTSIGEAAFKYCRSLTSINIPNSVTEIGGGAFADCSGLTSVTIPNSVTSIGEYAFLGCESLTSVHITDLSAWCNISFDGSYSNPLSLAHHLFLNGKEVTDLVIPNSVTSIGDYAFTDCTGLTSVTIGNSVISIGHCAFSDCIGLTSVTIPNSVTEIGGGAFEGCSGLTSITIPNSVTIIGVRAFYDCI